jgi:hypothetical protein
VRRREIRKREKQAKGEQRREVQGSRWCRCSMCLGVSPIPPTPPYLPGQVRELPLRYPPLPPSTHLQLLQFPEAAEDLCNSLQTEVESRKPEIGQLKRATLLLRFFYRMPRSREIDCWKMVKISEILSARRFLSTPIFCDFLAWQAGTTQKG